MKAQKFGISIITLVITIVVIIILVGAIVISISNNNPIKQATEAVRRNDVAELIDQYNLIYVTELGKNNGNKEKIDSTKFSDVIPGKYKEVMEADKYGIHYLGTDEQLIDYINSLESDVIFVDKKLDTNIYTNFSINLKFADEITKQKSNYMLLKVELIEEVSGKKLTANIGTDGTITSDDSIGEVFKSYDIVDNNSSNNQYKDIEIKSKIRWNKVSVAEGNRSNIVHVKISMAGYKSVEFDISDGNKIINDVGIWASEYGYRGNVNRTVSTDNELLAGDTSGDGIINLTDYSLVTQYLDKVLLDSVGNLVSGMEDKIGIDLNRDGIIDIKDYNILMKNYN